MSETVTKADSVSENKEQSSEYPTPQEARYIDDLGLLTKMVIDATESGEPPPLASALALLSRSVQETIDHYVAIPKTPFAQEAVRIIKEVLIPNALRKNDYRTVSIWDHFLSGETATYGLFDLEAGGSVFDHWPEGSDVASEKEEIRLRESRLSGSIEFQAPDADHIIYVLNPPPRKLFPRDVPCDEDGNPDFGRALAYATLASLRTLSPGDKARALDWFSTLIPYIGDSSIFAERLESVIRSCPEFKTASPGPYATLEKSLLNSASSETDKYDSGDASKEPKFFDADKFIRDLAKESPDGETLQALLGILVNQDNYVDILNKLREIILMESIDSKLVAKLNRLGRALQGNDPDDLSIPFYAQNSDFYRDMRSDQLPQLTAETGEEIKIIKEKAGSVKKVGAIIDLASGQGRLAIPLAKIGLRPVIALDLSAEMLQTIENQKLDITSIAADMTRIPLEDDTAKIIECFGRSLMELSRDQLRDLAHEIKRLIGNDGLFLFNYGSRDCLKFQKDLMRTVKVLRSIDSIEIKGLSDVEAMARTRTVIGSPDPEKKKWVNRYLYTREEIAQIFDEAGLTLENIAHRPIPGIKGAMTDYYLARAKPPPASNPVEESIS